MASKYTYTIITDKEPTKYIVYMATSPSNKKYIGITSQKMENRISRHVSDSNSNKKINIRPFLKAIKKYDINNIKFEIIDFANNDDKLQELERYYIKYYNTFGKGGYNATEGGEGTLGKKVSEEARLRLIEYNKNRVLSEETKKKMSESAKGRPGSRLGKTASEETKKRISEAKKGCKPTDETKAKLSEIRKGHLVSEETRTKISVAQKGRIGYNIGIPRSEETRKKISESHKGRKKSAEHIVKMSENMKGKPSPRKGVILSEETKQKISEKTKGRKPWNYILETPEMIEDIKNGMTRRKFQEKYNTTGVWRRYRIKTN